MTFTDWLPMLLFVSVIAWIFQLAGVSGDLMYENDFKKPVFKSKLHFLWCCVPILPVIFSITIQISRIGTWKKKA